MLAAQVPAPVWEKSFSKYNYNVLRSIVPTPDSGAILAGSSHSSEGPQDGYWIVKISRTGSKQWDKLFGGNSSDFLSTIIPTSDGGYLLGGGSSSGISGDKSEASRGSSDFWIVKISSTGSKEWDKTFGGSSRDYLSSIVPTPDGGYLLGGDSYSGISGDKSEANRGDEYTNDYWVVKIDSTGNKQWDKTFGTSSSDYLESVIATADGGYLLGGYTGGGLEGDKSDSSRGSVDFWIVKITSSGNKQWDKTYGGNSDDWHLTLLATRDGAYLLAGTSSSEISGDKESDRKGYGDDFWVVKINSNGSKQWDKTYGTKHFDALKTIIPTAEGGYLLAGYSNGWVEGDKSEDCLGDCSWILKINEQGIKQGDKSFSHAEQGYYLTTIAQTADNSYLIGADLNLLEYSSSEYVVLKTTADPVESSPPSFWINSGGTAFTTFYGKSFAADGYVSGGWPTSFASGEVENTNVDTLFLDARQGRMIRYDFPTGKGDFRVLLHFNELYYGNQVPGGIGSRKFKVNIEGVRKLTEYDIFATAGGAMKAVTEGFTTHVADSVLTVQLVKGSAGLALISAIEIFPIAIPVPTARIASKSSTTHTAFTLASLAPNPVQDRLWVNFPSSPSQVLSIQLTDLTGRVYFRPDPGRIKENQLAVETGILKAGVYLLKVETSEGSQVLKFIKQ
jgi:hypothetical protein